MRRELFDIIETAGNVFRNYILSRCDKINLRAEIGRINFSHSAKFYCASIHPAFKADLVSPRIAIDHDDDATQLSCRHIFRVFPTNSPTRIPRRPLTYEGVRSIFRRAEAIFRSPKSSPFGSTALPRRERRLREVVSNWNVRPRVIPYKSREGESCRGSPL